MRTWLGVLAVAASAGFAAAAGTNEPAVEVDAAAFSNKVAKFLASIEYRTGEVKVGDGLAVFRVPDAFRFIGPKDAEKVLRLWGNPPGDTPPLGMLFPKGATPLTEDTWAVVIEYEDSGYVKDDDADQIDYAALLRKMQEGTRAANKERTKQGYESIALVGWAAPPRYDQATHKMYWAKELEFGGQAEHTLNYNIRILGRRGVLVLNAVSGMTQLKDIEAATPGLLAMVDFQEGHRYVDFDPSKDKYAAYGLAALVAGGVAAKAGLLKGLIAAIIAAKKLIIVGFVALGAFIKRFFGRGQQQRPPQA